MKHMLILQYTANTVYVQTSIDLKSVVKAALKEEKSLIGC